VATAPVSNKENAVSHGDFLNNCIQKRINSVARAIEYRFKKKISELEDIIKTLKSKHDERKENYDTQEREISRGKDLVEELLNSSTGFSKNTMPLRNTGYKNTYYRLDRFEGKRKLVLCKLQHGETFDSVEEKVKCELIEEEAREQREKEIESRKKQAREQQTRELQVWAKQQAGEHQARVHQQREHQARVHQESKLQVIEIQDRGQVSLFVREHEHGVREQKEGKENEDQHQYRNRQRVQGKIKAGEDTCTVIHEIDQRKRVFKDETNVNGNAYEARNVSNKIWRI